MATCRDRRNDPDGLHDLEETVVHHPSETPAEVRFRPVEDWGRRHRDRLHVDAHAIHVTQSNVGKSEAAYDLRDVLLVVRLADGLAYPKNGSSPD
jgi:hypothetical protein